MEVGLAVGLRPLLSPPLFYSDPVFSPPSLSNFAIPCLSSNKLSRAPLHITVTKERKRSTSLRSSSNEATFSASSERWLLQPVGDGDSRHIGFRVPLPNAFEIASDVVTVGRLPEKADVVIPVATVSGLHARLEKKEGILLITDLDSTNGTFIDDRRLGPGDIARVLPGNCVTFGDTNLAMFRVSKIKSGAAAVKPTSKTEEVEVKVDAEVANVNLKSAD